MNKGLFKLLVFVFFMAIGYVRDYDAPKQTITLESTQFSPGVAMAVATRAGRTPIAAGVEPSATPTDTPAPTDTPTATPTRTPAPTFTATSNDSSTPSPVGSLRKSATPPPLRFDVVAEAHGYEWVSFSNVDITLLYPNEWWIEPTNNSIYSSSRDYSFSVEWTETEEDLNWLYYRDNQKSTFTKNMVRMIEQDSLEFLGTIGEIVEFSRFEQKQLGEYLTFGEVVYEAQLTNEWTDAEKLFYAFGNAKCGDRRMCFITYSKIDEPITSADWELLDYFVGSIQFPDEASPTATSTSAPTETPEPTKTPLPTQTPKVLTAGEITREGNIRSRPGSSNPVIGTLEVGAKVVISGYITCGPVTWLQIGKEQWILGHLVDVQPLNVPRIDINCSSTPVNVAATATPIPTPLPPTPLSTAVTPTQTGRTTHTVIQSGLVCGNPCSCSPVARTIIRGAQVAVLETTSCSGGTWYRIGEGEWLAPGLVDDRP